MNQRAARSFRRSYDDELALLDLAQWLAFYGGYDKTTPHRPGWNGIACMRCVSACRDSDRRRGSRNLFQAKAIS